MQATPSKINLSRVDIGVGRPLVFLHGFPLSRDTWRKQIHIFRSSYRVIAPDLRGFGGSATLPGPTTMRQYATDVRALLEQAVTGPVMLVGHSMGGYVALALLRQFPGMLRGLVLVSTRAGADTADGAMARRVMAEKVNAEGIQVVLDAIAPKMLAAGNSNPQLAEEVRRLMATSKPEGVIGALLGMAGRPDATEGLARIMVPTLIITGADDALMPPEESEALHKKIRGSQLRIIPHAGHLVALEQPEEFNRVLQEWLSREDSGWPRQPRSEKD